LNIKVNNCHSIHLKKIIDEKDGVLSVGEAMREIPFLIKRVYYIYDFFDQESIRGLHAHKALEQVLFCLGGKFSMHLDDGINKETIQLDKPNYGLYLGPMVWHKMTHFSTNSIILVLCSDQFKESDYIRDYKEFCTLVKSNDSTVA